MSDVYKKNILRLLDNKGMTPAVLERRLGFGNAYVRSIKDETVPYRRLKMIADELGVPLSEIVTDGFAIGDDIKAGFEEFMLLQDKILVSYMKKLSALAPNKREYIFETIDMIG